MEKGGEQRRGGARQSGRTDLTCKSVRASRGGGRLEYYMSGIDGTVSMAQVWKAQRRCTSQRGVR